MPALVAREKNNNKKVARQQSSQLCHVKVLCTSEHANRHLRNSASYIQYNIKIFSPGFDRFRLSMLDKTCSEKISPFKGEANKTVT